jgi:hypothetical protein
LNRELQLYYPIDQGSFVDMDKQKNCFVCGNEFKDSKDCHRHHDHKVKSNNVLGYACSRCNLQMTEKRRSGIPVFFHNGSHYDWKFLIQEVGSEIEEQMEIPENLEFKHEIEDVQILGLNSENYITIKWQNIWFLDSLKFLSASLESLVNTLTNEDMKLAIKLYQKNGITSMDQMEILTQKGIFPYLWFDSYDKFSEKSLPPIERFAGTSEKDYNQALKAWNVLGCNTFEDYHDKYLLSDVILLATVFHTFRMKIYKQFDTDPAYFLGLPGLSWSIAMKYVPKDQVIELLEHPEDYIKFQNNIRGGNCQVFQRFAKRQYEEEIFEESISQDPVPSKRSTSQILYLDVNGLYGHIMANFKLPYKLIKHVQGDCLEEWDIDDDFNEILVKGRIIDHALINELIAKDHHTYFIELDASIAEDIIERNPGIRQFPCFPVKINEKTTKKSQFMQHQCDTHKIHDTDTFKLATLLDKTENYLVHIKMLKLALDQGYKIEKIHGYYKFEHGKESVFKTYIDGNAERKKKAKIAGDDFEEMLNKLLSNIIFGKSIQNIMKQRDFEIIYTPNNDVITR